MEAVFSRTRRLLISDVDISRRVRPGVLLRMTQDISGEHFESMEMGPSRVPEKRAMWIIARLSMELARMPVYLERVTLETWTGKMSHGMFQRHYRMADEKNGTLLRAVSVWALMDAAERHLVTDPEAYGICVPACPREGELPAPGRPAVPALENTALRHVRYSELDMNGHVNNTRYLDWADDLLPVEFHRKNELAQLCIHFRREIRQGETPELHWKLDDSGAFACRGFVDGAESFTLTERYRPCP